MSDIQAEGDVETGINIVLKALTAPVRHGKSQKMGRGSGVGFNMDSVVVGWANKSNAFSFWHAVVA